MKKYKTPEFESVYFEVDTQLMDAPVPGPGGEVVTNPWGDEFESGDARFNGLSLKA